MKKQIRSHYHWIVAAALFIHLGIYVGFLNAKSIFILPITEELGISRSSYSLAVNFLSGLTRCLSLMVSGFVFRKIGYRKALGIGMPVAAVGFAVSAFSNDVIGLCVGAVIEGMVFGMCASVTANRIINEWFHRHRGTVWGVLAATTGLGGSAWSSALPSVMEISGWRGAYLLIGGCVLILMVIDWIFLRDKPADMGLQPYGEGEHLPAAKAAMAEAGYFQGCSFAELVRRPVFYVMLVALIVIFTGIYIPNSVLVAHGCDRGLSNDEAASLQSILLLALAAVKILFGWLMDRIGVRKVLLICCICGTVSMIALAGMTDYTQAMVASLIYSLALPATTLIVPALTIDLFGYHSSVTAIGIFSSLISVGSMAAGPISNIVFDTAGSYAPAFQVAAAALVVMVGVMIVVYRMADADRKKLEQTAQ